jgi:hypothetical protein
MVGDPAQLPATVLSLTAKENDYHQSLFKRFFKIFASDIGPDGKVQDPTHSLFLDFSDHF